MLRVADIVEFEATENAFSLERINFYIRSEVTFQLI